MRLYLVRHAEAGPGEPDDLRRLTPSGRATARALGERLASAAAPPDAILTSPLLRARETGDEIARATGVTSEPDERLAPGAEPEDVLAAVAGRGPTVVVVGHQPDCGRIAAALSGTAPPAFPPGTMVELTLT